jgi:DNA processing protein
MTHPTASLNHSQKLDWLRLIRSENVGPRTFQKLLFHFGDAAQALAALPDMAKRGGRSKPIRICPKEEAEREYDYGLKLGHTLLAQIEPTYPRLLAEIDDAPPVIWACGDMGLFNRPIIAMVGARNASLNGRNLTRRLASDLGRAGLVVASGLARGVDASAHEGSLATGTVAVMAGGLDVIYPPEHTDLYRMIIEAGVAVSEMPPGTQPQSGHFPRRNRIVSGLSLGVLVVEASLKSGSLITARMAADQGRDVFAVPGSPLDPRAQGPNDLLRHGATLTETAADILEALAPKLHRPLSEPFSPPSHQAEPQDFTESELRSARASLVECLGFSPVTVDEIIRQCQLSPALVSLILLELELAGRLERQTGHRVSLVSD